MLKALEYKKRKPVKVEFDIYTPINIEFGTWNISKEPTIYWRTGDFKKSLIEIGIGKRTGDIRSITLILSENVFKVENDHFDSKNLPVIKGIPVFKIDQFINKNYTDEEDKLNIYIGEDKIYMLFSENEMVSLVQNDNVEFGIDSNDKVCSIIISNVGENEKKTVEEALKS
ncbi:hypothetical protein E4665_16545 [Sporolactobacillus shoreae]|uniref:Uncharacterized protein n=1 Tax=Sporolactobacillus shoreae TaxID=1465501 RepID=A0A4Z0GKL1_9BACL|nr:hypothetical protein [Sporolactobacillus shoreae]TGA96118.1 hypothetical protein E4665_16545 [Sporolactobacillus shoreae]